jgi:hypothetical protein
LVSRLIRVPGISTISDFFSFYFHYHTDCSSFQGLQTLGLICHAVFFTTTDSILILYSNLMGSQPEQASVAWNSISLKDSSKLKEFKENVQFYGLVGCYVTDIKGC